MTTITPLQAVETVLIAHQRMDIRSCLCGWGDIGKSHATHVGKLVIEALRVPEQDPDQSPPSRGPIEWETFAEGYNRAILHILGEEES